MNKERLNKILDDLPYSIRYSGDIEPLKKYAKEQAERVQELEVRHYKQELIDEHIERLEQQNKRYREVIEKAFYKLYGAGKLPLEGFETIEILDEALESESHG